MMRAAHVHVLVYLYSFTYFCKLYFRMLSTADFREKYKLVCRTLVTLNTNTIIMCELYSYRNSNILFIHERKKKENLSLTVLLSYGKYVSSDYKVHKYLEYHSVCPLVGIGIPHPLSPKRVCTSPPWTKDGGTRSPAGDGLGSPNSPIQTTGEKA